MRKADGGHRKSSGLTLEDYYEDEIGDAVRFVLDCRGGMLRRSVRELAHQADAVARLAKAAVEKLTEENP